MAYCKRPYLIIDFDSTFTQAEGLDELARIALEQDPGRDDKLRQIRELTGLGMSGALPVSESLSRRLALLNAYRHHLPPLITFLRQSVTPSVLANRSFFRRYAGRIYIVSNGFYEFIYPVVSDFGMAPGHVLANRFTYTAEGRITGLDQSVVLSRNGGKTAAVKELNLTGEVWVIGDGHTDYEIRKAGLAQRFIAFTENVSRPGVVALADQVAGNFNEIIKEIS